MTRVEKEEAKATLAALVNGLVEHSDLIDPFDVCENAEKLMKEIDDDIRVILGYLGADISIGLDRFGLRDLLLADATVFVDFRCPDGVGRIAMACRDRSLTIIAAPASVMCRWSELLS